METYGVSFEGFEPWWEKETYDDVVKNKIPNCETTLATAKRDLEELKRVTRAVEELRKPMLGMKDLAERAEAIVRESVVSKDCRMHELLRTGSEDSQKLLKGYEEYHKWLKDDCLVNCENIGDLYAWMEDIVKHDYKLYDGLVDEVSVELDFWRLTVETAKIEYLFENAEKKYKAKVCRDAVRDLVSLMDNGQAYLKWLENSHIRYSEEQLASRKKNVKAIMDDMNKLLGFYKKMKAYIADHGIDKALVQYEKAKTGPSRKASEGVKD